MMSLYNKLIYLIKLLLSRAILLPKTQSTPQCCRLGRRGADWWVPVSLIKKDWIVYCGGVGEDVSFDLELMKACKTGIFAFDPTPRAITFAGEISKRLNNFHFFDWGLWSKNKKMKFYEPKNKQHVSHSLVNLQNTEDFFVAECKSLDWIMNKLNHDKIDLLKIDIEGAEYEILSDLLNKKILPTVLCVEFDQPTPLLKMLAMIWRLFRSGYVLLKQDHFNFTFYRT